MDTWAHYHTRNPPQRPTRPAHPAITAAKARLLAIGLTEPEAYRWLQRNAMDTRRTMVEVAEEVLATWAVAAE